MSMTIYDRRTGAARVCENVDAREILESAPEIYSDKPVDPLDHAFDDKKGGSLAGGEGGFHGMKVADLKSLAELRKIDLGDATKKGDIIAALELPAEEAAKAEVVEPAAE